MNPQTPKKSPHSFTFEGKTYENFEDLPDDIKKKYDKDGNGVPDLVDFFQNIPFIKTINKDGQKELNTIKIKIGDPIDPVKLNAFFEWIRGIVFLIAVIGFLAYWLSK